MSSGTETNLSGLRGGFNGSTQHSARTQLALKTKAKIARYGWINRNVALAKD